MIGLGLLLMLIGIILAIFATPYAGAIVLCGVVLVVVGAVLGAGTWGWQRPR